MSNRYADLIGKLATLDGPDREVDAEILCTFLAPVGSKVVRSPFNDAWVIYEPRAYSPRPFALWEKPRPWRLDHESLTGSLDAAIALTERLLPGIWWVIAKGKTTLAEPMYGAQLFFGEHEEFAPGEGPTPAIALLIATLKAHDNLKEANHG